MTGEDDLKTLLRALEEGRDEVVKALKCKYKSELAEALNKQQKFRIEDLPRDEFSQVLVDNSIDSQAVEKLKKAFGLSGQSVNFVAIRARFTFQQFFNDRYQRFAFMPSILIPKVKSDGRASWINEFLDFAESYKDDFPDFINLKSEMDTWETYWTKHYVGVVPERMPAVIRILETISFAFPNMMTALRILGTIPVTTCECERSISALGRLKSYLRTTMTEKRLNGLAMLHVHSDIEINFDSVINDFANRENHKIKLKNILDSDNEI